MPLNLNVIRHSMWHSEKRSRRNQHYFNLPFKIPSIRRKDKTYPHSEQSVEEEKNINFGNIADDLTDIQARMSVSLSNEMS